MAIRPRYRDSILKFQLICLQVYLALKEGELNAPPELRGVFTVCPLPLSLSHTQLFIFILLLKQFPCTYIFH